MTKEELAERIGMVLGFGCEPGSEEFEIAVRRGEEISEQVYPVFEGRPEDAQSLWEALERDLMNMITAVPDEG